jgi:hypothetical protein
MDDLSRLTRDYWIAVQRVRRLPVPERDKVVVMAASRRSTGRRGRQT